MQCTDSPSFAPSRHVEAHVGEGGDGGGPAAVLLNVAKLLVREIVIAEFAVRIKCHLHDLPGFGNCEWPYQYSIDDAKDGGICADAQGKRKNRHSGEAGDFASMRSA